MQKVTECKREMTLTGKYVYRVKLACGCHTFKSCRWNRREFVPGPPTKMKCGRCDSQEAMKGGGA